MEHGAFGVVRFLCPPNTELADLFSYYLFDEAPVKTGLRLLTAPLNPRFRAGFGLSKSYLASVDHMAMWR